jgi:hypothetical protein
MPRDRAAVLELRLAGERARLSDLNELLRQAVDTDDRRLTGLEDRIERRATSLDVVRGRTDGLEAWADAVRDADLLVEEVIGLLLTRVAREGNARRTFEAAEALLDELVRRADVPAVLLGQTPQNELLDLARSTVALRFPGSRVWELPFLGHEFGHHAVLHLRHLEPELSDRRPLQEVVESVAGSLSGSRPATDKATSHAHELVADVVAVACLGATYGVACLCLRMPEEVAAARSSLTHPTWRNRVAVVRAALDTLSEVTGLPRYTRQRSADVDPLVKAVLGEVPPCPPAVLEAAAATVTTLVTHRPGLIYRDADSALAVTAALNSQEPFPPHGASVTAVVDGAWRWRLGSDSRAMDEKTATLVADYCRTLGGRHDAYPRPADTPVGRSSA